MKTLFEFNSSLKNAYSRNRKFFTCRYSKNIITIVRILYYEGFIDGFHISPFNHNFILVKLKYTKGKPVFKGIMSLSKPSQRLYVKSNFIKDRNYKEGFFFLSSSKEGIVLCNSFDLSNKNFGGELLGKLII
jgi:ribosomal protein S8